MIHCQPLHVSDGVNHNSAPAIGPALMSVILTSSFHGSEHVANDLSDAYAGGVCGRHDPGRGDRDPRVVATEQARARWGLDAP